MTRLALWFGFEAFTFAILFASALWPKIGNARLTVVACCLFLVITLYTIGWVILAPTPGEGVVSVICLGTTMALLGGSFIIQYADRRIRP